MGAAVLCLMVQVTMTSVVWCKTIAILFSHTLLSAQLKLFGIICDRFLFLCMSQRESETYSCLSVKHLTVVSGTHSHTAVCLTVFFTGCTLADLLQITDGNQDKASTRRHHSPINSEELVKPSKKSANVDIFAQCASSKIPKVGKQKEVRTSFYMQH